jgi:asparagine synthase (glutamine-hydrolysing)
MNTFAGHFLARAAATVSPPRPGSSQAGTSGLRRLTLDEPRLKLALAFDTLTASWHRDGPRSLLTVGLHPSTWGTRSPSEAAELMTQLADNAPAALLRLRGGWVVLFVDESRNRCLLATDRAATRAPCFASLPDRIAFGLTALDVMHCDKSLEGVRPQAIFDYLHSHFIPAPDTVFAGVERLLPGEYVEAIDGRVSRRRYWQPSYEAPDVPFDFTRDKATFRRLLEESVRAEVGIGATGAFLSGGTDSSTVAGMLGHVTGAPANTYSIGFDVPGFDEMSYARIAASHFGTRHHEYYVTPDDLVQNIPAVATAYDQPFGNSSALPAFYCARLAHADGITRILGGDGGDELFGGNTRYAKQKLFDVYSRAPAWVRTGLVEPVLLGSTITRRIPLVKKARSYVEQANVPMPGRLHTYNLMDRIGVQQMFTPAFIAAVDTGAASRRENAYYARCGAGALVDRMLCYDWKFTLADNDLPKVVGTCDLAGLAIGFPMLNEDLAAFANALPARQKVKGLQLRHFFKAALADFLPREIIAKKKHGFGLPFGLWLVKHEGLRRLAFDSLHSLRTRGVVRREFVDELLAPRLQEHASYYGELVWVMMMLEQWLQAHRPDHVHAG